jgi:hypothetical protein
MIGSLDRMPSKPAVPVCQTRNPFVIGFAAVDTSLSAPEFVTVIWVTGDTKLAFDQPEFSDQGFLGCLQSLVGVLVMRRDAIGSEHGENILTLFF